MDIFISWSKPKSEQVAIFLRGWLKSVIHSLDPWISEGIRSGERWNDEINKKLATTSLGIICITQENKDNPWLLFEAGAMAKERENARVCPLLIDLEGAQLQYPLAQFQATKLTKPDIFKLIASINSFYGEKALKDDFLKKSFEINWPEFENEIPNFIKSIQKEEVVRRSPENLSLEILESVRAFDRRLGSMEVNVHNLISNSTKTAIRKKMNFDGNVALQQILRNTVRDLQNAGASESEILIQIGTLVQGDEKSLRFASAMMDFDDISDDKL